MTNRVVVIVVESNNIKNSDCIYLKEYIEEYHNYNNIPVRYAFMGGKHNYKKQNVKDQIQKHISVANDYDIIYVFDKDDHHLDYNDNKHINNVIRYCKKHEYHIVWFVRNIEDVFLGRTPDNKDNAATRFKNTKQIKNIDLKKISSPNPQQRYTSNIKCVFDEVFKKD